MNINISSENGQEHLIEESKKIKSAEAQSLEKICSISNNIQDLEQRISANTKNEKELEEKLSNCLLDTKNKYFFASEVFNQITSQRKFGFDLEEILAKIYEIMTEINTEKNNLELIMQEGTLPKYNHQLEQKYFIQKEKDRLENEINCLQNQFETELKDLSLDMAQKFQANLKSMTKKIKQLSKEIDECKSSEIKIKSNCREVITKMQRLYQAIGEKKAMLNQINADIKSKICLLSKISDVGNSSKLQGEIDYLKIKNFYLEKMLEDDQEQTCLEDKLSELIKVGNDIRQEQSNICVSEKESILRTEHENNKLKEMYEENGKTLKENLSCYNNYLVEIAELEKELSMAKEDYTNIFDESKKLKKLLEANSKENDELKKKENVLQNELILYESQMEIVKEHLLHKAKVDMLENLANESSTKQLNELNDITNQIKEIEENMNLNIKQNMENMKKLKLDQEEELTLQADNFKKEIENLEAEIYNFESENSRLKMINYDHSSELRSLTLQSDIISREINSLKNKPLNNTFIPPVAPRKRTFDELSDSSAEGKVFSIDQIAAIRRSQDKRRNLKGKGLKTQKSK